MSPIFTLSPLAHCKHKKRMCVCVRALQERAAHLQRWKRNERQYQHHHDQRERDEEFGLHPNPPQALKLPPMLASTPAWNSPEVLVHAIKGMRPLVTENSAHARAHPLARLETVIIHGIPSHDTSCRATIAMTTQVSTPLLDAFSTVTSNLKHHTQADGRISGQ